MASSKLTMKLFLLDKYTSLEEVKDNILNRTYSDPLFIAKRNTEQAKTMPDSEKNFYYNWDKEKIKLESIVVSEKGDFFVENRILECFAELEYPKKKKIDSQGMILPKKDRVNETLVRVVFFEIENSIYLLIFSSNETHIDRVQKLIGANLIKDVDKKYQIEPDFFNWLLYENKPKNGKKSLSSFIIRVKKFFLVTVMSSQDHRSSFFYL